MLRIGGEYYVRSIQRADAEHNLIFFCAIDEGLVLTVGNGGDLVGEMAGTFATLRERVPAVDFVLACECILRRVEIENRGLREDMGSLMAANRVIGFHTYGEQFGSVHINQTITGIAVGR